MEHSSNYFKGGFLYMENVKEKLKEEIIKRINDLDDGFNTIDDEKAYVEMVNNLTDRYVKCKEFDFEEQKLILEKSKLDEERFAREQEVEESKKQRTHDTCLKVTLSALSAAGTLAMTVLLCTLDLNGGLTLNALKGFAKKIPTIIGK